MGFFDWIRRKRNNAASGALAQYSGMRVEVMDLRERLLFIARASVSWEEGMTLQAVSTPRLNEGTRDYPVLLRGYREKEQKAIHMQGRITARGNGMWSVSGVRVTRKGNDRAFFRQEISLEAEIVPIRQVGLATKSCRVIDISLGGACIRAREEFMLGERLLLKLDLRGDESVMPLMCQVRRGMRKMGYYEYGCEFQDLSPKLEATINAAIMELQRKRIRRE